MIIFQVRPTLPFAKHAIDIKPSCPGQEARKRTGTGQNHWAKREIPFRQPDNHRVIMAVVVRLTRTPLLF
jgi:hypothetical protein